MKVLKFGGTSVGSIKNIFQVKNIVNSISEPTIVIVSAVGGITDKLINTAKKASLGNKEYEKDLKEIINIHQNIIDGVIAEKDKKEVYATINLYFEELANIYNGVFLIKDLSEKTLDVIESYGERISSFFLYTLTASRLL